MFNFFKRNKTQEIKEEIKEKPFVYSNGESLKEKPLVLQEPFTLAKYRLENGAKDIGATKAKTMLDNHKVRLSNQWFNPSISVNSGWGTIQHSLYNYQNVNYYECMMLAQDPLMNKILNILSETPFKKGGKLVGVDVEQEEVDRINKKYKIQETMIKALKESFMCGGCLVYLDFGIDENLEEKLDLSKINLKDFKGFRIINPLNCGAVEVNTYNPTKADYMKPEKWYIAGIGVVDKSRFFYFSQNEVPDILKPLTLYFGYPLTQLIKQDVANSNTISQGIAELMGKFRFKYLKMPKNNFATDAVENLKARLEFDLNAQDNFGVSLIADDEDMIQLTTNLTGLRENHEMSYLLISSKTSIPYTELIGKSAEGMNATGEGDRKCWYDKVETIRNSIKNNLVKMYQIAFGAETGKIMDFTDFIFEPLEELTEKEQIEVFKGKVEIGRELIETYGADNENVFDWLKDDKRMKLDSVELYKIDGLLDYEDKNTETID